MSRTYRFLAIDPGTNCGYSWLDVTSTSVLSAALKPLIDQSGVWDLSVRRHESMGMRAIKLKASIASVCPDIIFYEEVRAHKGTNAAHVYGGLTQTITMYAAERGIEHYAIPVGTIKKHATGKGSANKAKMIEAANEHFAIDPPLSNAAVASNKDDNIADAMWIMDVALRTYASGLDFNAIPSDVVGPALDDLRLTEVERASLAALLQVLSPAVQDIILGELKSRRN